MEEYLMILIPVGVLVLLAAVYVPLYNRLQRLQVKVEEAGSGIDVALEKRYDMLSEQLETVKKYLAHEYETLTGVTALRTGASQEEQRLTQQQELSDEVIRSIDQEISRQTQSMDKIKRQLEQNRIYPGRKRRSARERDAQPEAPPYHGAGNYFLIKDVENHEMLTRLAAATCESLPGPKPGRM